MLSSSLSVRETKVYDISFETPRDWRGALSACPHARRAKTLRYRLTPKSMTTARNQVPVDCHEIATIAARGRHEFAGNHPSHK